MSKPQVMVLVITHKHGENISVHVDNDDAERALDEYVDSQWDSETPSVPRPEDKEDMRSQYFEVFAADEDYFFHLVDIEGDLGELRRAITEHDIARDNEVVLAELRRLLADEPDAVKVVFDTSEWDNGWFYVTPPTVHFKDGDTGDTDEFSNEAESAMANLSHEYGPLGNGHTLTVNLATGEFDPDSND